jgi:hypothetical protein
MRHGEARWTQEADGWTTFDTVNREESQPIGPGQQRR